MENEVTTRPIVLLLIPHLGGGGAEKVFALLAKGLSGSKYSLHLGIILSGWAATEELPPSVTLHALRATRVRSAAFRLLALVRRLKPRVILSGMYHLNFLVLLLKPFFPRSTRILVRQNGTLSASLSQDGLPGYTRTLYRILYRRADRILCQSGAMAAEMARELGLAPNLLGVLLNPLDIDAIRSTTSGTSNQWSGAGPHLLAVGRLSKEKGFDLFLEAISQLGKRFPTLDARIVGSGAEESALKEQCKRLGLEDAVQFAGRVDHPCTYFPGASVFVLSSRHEGMPNALLEAAAAGLPLVSLPACGGVADLLRGQPGTWLASEVSAASLAATLLDALATLRPGQRFPHPFLEPFCLDRALSGYEAVIDSALREPRS